ncbi:glycosyltransferase [Microbacterium sp. BWT-B31]|uniref:glycosyltransferase n=1 Tax=Microbacterium sp. BWT-B31 TaxID=3232072 RepID=UPI0035279573
MAPTASTPDPRDTRIGRVAASVYWYLMVEAGFLLAAAPGLVGLALVVPEPGSIPLYALCAVPFAPAFSAALYALRGGTRGPDQNPWPRFWRGWRMNVADVLWVWIPVVAVGAAVGIGIAFGPAAGVPALLVVISWVLLAVLAVWAGIAVVICSWFSFRARDVARLASYYLAARPLVGLGFASLLIVAVALTFFASGWFVALTASIFVGFARVTARPMERDIEERFLAPDAAADAAHERGDQPPG